MKICHVVRHWGGPGGMERYVMNLVGSLRKYSANQVVVCAQSFANLECVRVVELGRKSLGKSASLSRQLLTFSENVCPELVDLKQDGFIIHSHERIEGHDVSTQHGPLIGSSIFSKFSSRYKTWNELEFKELNCRAIVPVSSLLSRDIARKYPVLANRIVGIGWPGMPCSDEVKLSAPISSFGSAEVKALFVGREVRRKGLKFAIEVVKHIRRLGWNMTLTVIGPDKAPKEFPGFVQFLGWKDSIPYQEFDLLIHPAKQEPFGMCVTEAYCSGIPSFVSENVGAKDLGLEGVFELALSNKPPVWAEKILSYFRSRQNLSMTYRWSWDDLARFYHREVYENL